MHRIERLINLIAALLDSPRPMSAEEIRRRIAGYDQPTDEAFRRAFERDKESLRAMGVPIEMRSTDAFSEQMDAYTIPRHRYYLPQLDLEDDEVAALRIASEILLGPGERAGAALLKLSLDSPPSQAGTRLVWGADLAAEQPLLAVLYEAVTQGRVVSFDYTTATGAGARRILEPYRLLHRHGHWYVVGRDRQRDAIRAFRVSASSPRSRSWRTALRFPKISMPRPTSARRGKWARTPSQRWSASTPACAGGRSRIWPRAR